MNNESSAKLKRLVYEGAEQKFKSLRTPVVTRLEHELAVINSRDYADRFLFFHKIAEICNRNKFLRSPGRSTTLNSLVNYCLDTTNINPLEHGLYLERYINKHRPHELIMNIDVPVGSFAIILKQLKEDLPEYEILRLAIPYENHPSTPDECFMVGDKKHAASGHIVYIIKAHEYGAYKRHNHNEQDYLLGYNFPDKGLPEIAYKILESSLLEKISTLNTRVGNGGLNPDIELNRPEVMRLFQDGNTKNVPFFGTSGIQDHLRRYSPSNIEELSHVHALYTEKGFGPLFLIDVFKKKNNFYRFKSSRKVNKILAPSYGIIVFQDTFLEIASKIAGMDLNDADLFRREITRNKDSEYMEILKMEFRSGCNAKKTLTEMEADLLFYELVDSFRYSLPKGHCISYTIMGYWCAYFKCHFPDEFSDVFGN